MTITPRKITLGQARQQGNTVLIFYCVTERPGRTRYGGGPNVCGHKGEVDIALAIDRYGEGVSLSDIPGRCSACGGRDIDVRGRGHEGERRRWF